jgi:hypothetical protein
MCRTRVLATLTLAASALVAAGCDDDKSNGPQNPSGVGAYSLTLIPHAGQ